MAVDNASLSCDLCRFMDIALIYIFTLEARAKK